MTLADTARLVAFLVLICPSTRVRETTTRTWHVLLADLDATDAYAAVVRLARRQWDITPCDVRVEAHAVREERLPRGPRPRPDADPDDPSHHRAESPAGGTVTASGHPAQPAHDAPATGPPAEITGHPARELRRRALQVSCPWCGAALGQPCTLPGSDIRLRRTLAHPARLIAAGLVETSGDDQSARGEAPSD